MASRYFVSPRIWLSRRLLRPPAVSISQRPSPRLFTSNSSLLSMNPQKLRPSVPFLSPTNISNQPTHIYILSRYRSSFTSLLTPERKRWLKHEGRSFVRYNLYIFAFIGLGFIIYAGVQMETLDRIYPAPREWSLTTRLWYSWACNLANEKTNGRGIVDWARVGSEMTDVLRVLEDPKKKEGKGTQATLQDDGQIYVEGVGKAGLDISLKSEPWRRGYYDVLIHLLARRRTWMAGSGTQRGILLFLQKSSSDPRIRTLRMSLMVLRILHWKRIAFRHGTRQRCIT